MRLTAVPMGIRPKMTMGPEAEPTKARMAAMEPETMPTETRFLTAMGPGAMSMESRPATEVMESRSRMAMGPETIPMETRFLTIMKPGTAATEIRLPVVMEHRPATEPTTRPAMEPGTTLTEDLSPGMSQGTMATAILRARTMKPEKGRDMYLPNRAMYRMMSEYTEIRTVDTWKKTVLTVHQKTAPTDRRAEITAAGYLRLPIWKALMKS